MNLLVRLDSVGAASDPSVRRLRDGVFADLSALGDAADDLISAGDAQSHSTTGEHNSQYSLPPQAQGTMQPQSPGFMQRVDYHSAPAAAEVFSYEAPTSTGRGRGGSIDGLGLKRGSGASLGGADTGAAAAAAEQSSTPTPLRPVNSRTGSGLSVLQGESAGTTPIQESFSFAQRPSSAGPQQPQQQQQQQQPSTRPTTPASTSHRSTVGGGSGTPRSSSGSNIFARIAGIGQPARRVEDVQELTHAAVVAALEEKRLNAPRSRLG